MTETAVATPKFNALTDAWLPLVQNDGSTVWASPVEVLCGEKDGVDLDYPRDDFRVYARLLLSALVQALFPAKNKAELLQRIDHPLTRPEVEKRIQPVLGDFELFGPHPFLQVVPLEKVPDGGAAPFAFPQEDLYRSAVTIGHLSIPIALVAVFTEMTYAGGAGRGYGAGPAGQPGALTLIDPGTVRAGAWANTLSAEYARDKYAADKPKPWSNVKRDAAPRASIGLVEGLFFQPRSAWLIPVGDGVCSFTGRRGEVVTRSPLRPKSELTKKPASSEDLWQHPCAPLAVNSQGIGAIRLNAGRPAWTGLAQLLAPISKTKSKKVHPNEGPAPVLQQWKTLANKSIRPRLLVLDFDRDKANVKRRFFESYPLTDCLLERKELIESLRDLVADAQEVRFELVKALTSAHDDRRLGGLALADAETAYWSTTEEHFLDWLSAATAVDAWDEQAEAAIEQARRAMHDSLRRTAMSLFDAQVSLSEFDPRKQERVAKARRRLRQKLFPRQDPATSSANAGSTSVQTRQSP